MNAKETDLIATAVVQLVKQAIEPLKARNEALEARLAELEGKALKDGGVWQAHKSYDLGDVITHSGSSWVCITAHVGGQHFPDHGFWRLLVKKGRDGRDAR